MRVVESCLIQGKDPRHTCVYLMFCPSCGGQRYDTLILELDANEAISDYVHTTPCTRCGAPVVGQFQHGTAHRIYEERPLLEKPYEGWEPLCCYECGEDFGCIHYNDEARVLCTKCSRNYEVPDLGEW